MDKQEIINKLREFPYSCDEYWVITGSAMVLYGIREQTHDIDIGCTTVMADQLVADGYSYQLKISENGEFKNIKSWEMDISSPNSYVVVGNHIYYGQNHMVTRLDLLTGKTDKSDSEIRELQS